MLGVPCGLGEGALEGKETLRRLGAQRLAGQACSLGVKKRTVQQESFSFCRLGGKWGGVRMKN